MPSQDPRPNQPPRKETEAERSLRRVRGFDAPAGAESAGELTRSGFGTVTQSVRREQVAEEGVLTRRVAGNTALDSGALKRDIEARALTHPVSAGVHWRLPASERSSHGVCVTMPLDGAHHRFSPMRSLIPVEETFVPNNILDMARQQETFSHQLYTDRNIQLRIESREIRVQSSLVRLPDYDANQLGIAILRFNPTDGRVSTVIPMLSDGLLAKFVATIEHEGIRTLLQRSTGIRVPDLVAEREHARFMDYVESQWETAREMLALSKPLPALISGTHGASVAYAGMQHAVVLELGAGRFAITDGLASCLGVGIVTANAVVVGHLASNSGAESLREMREQVGLQPGTPAKIVFTGGVGPSPEIIEAFREAKRWKQQGYDLEFVVGPLLVKSGSTPGPKELRLESLAIDLSTGKIGRLWDRPHASARFLEEWEHAGSWRARAALAFREIKFRWKHSD